MQNTKWKHLYDEDDENGCQTRTVKLLVDVITPELLSDILENAYKDSKSGVYIDVGFPLQDGKGIRFADNHTYHDEIMVIEEKYRELGVTYGYFF